MNKKKNLQLNNIIFNIIKIDFFEASEFYLWQTAAFDFQEASIVVNFTANAFFWAIAMISFDIFG